MSYISIYIAIAKLGIKFQRYKKSAKKMLTVITTANTCTIEYYKEQSEKPFIVENHL